jgi:hypothetical protein
MNELDLFVATITVTDPRERAALLEQHCRPTRPAATPPLRNKMYASRLGAGGRRAGAQHEAPRVHGLKGANSCQKDAEIAAGPTLTNSSLLEQ